MSLDASFQSGVSAVQSRATGAQSILKGGDFLNSLTARGPAFLRPKTVQGIGGFVFDYAGEISVTKQADVTDHYLEDNSTTNDHMGIRPVRLVMKGMSSELVMTAPGGILGILSVLQNKLGVLPSLLGKYTPQATQKVQAALTQAQKSVNQLDNGLARVKNLVGLFGKANPGNGKQSKAYLILEAMMDTRQVFLVETPYRVFDNMVLESLSVVQPEDTKFQSDIVIGLKQLRFAQVKVSSVSSPDFGGRAGPQRAPLSDNGRTKGGSILFDPLQGPVKAILGLKQ